MITDPLLSTQLVAAFCEQLGVIVSTSTLEGWRTQRRGPPYSKLGSRVYYRRSDVLKWLEGTLSQTRVDTMEAA